MEQSVEILLCDDHLAIDALYDQYLEMKRAQPEQALDAFKKYKASLLRHIKCEEDLIFQVLVQTPAEPASDEVSTLREEHQIIVPLLMEVEKHLKLGTDSSHSERRLFEELHEHNAREEMRVYGCLDRIIGGSQKEAVVKALSSQRLFS
jgi:hemerythrin superfamily protein